MMMMMMMMTTQGNEIMRRGGGGGWGADVGKRKYGPGPHPKIRHCIPNGCINSHP